MGAQLIAINEWLGHHGEPLEPSAMQFTIKPATSCRGCVFFGQRASVCNMAGRVAIKAGMPDCESGSVIYVLKEVDPRQQTIPA